MIVWRAALWTHVLHSGRGCGSQLCVPRSFLTKFVRAGANGERTFGCARFAHFASRGCEGDGAVVQGSGHGAVVQRFDHCQEFERGRAHRSSRRAGTRNLPACRCIGMLPLHAIAVAERLPMFAEWVRSASAHIDSSFRRFCCFFVIASRMARTTTLPATSHRSYRADRARRRASSAVSGLSDPPCVQPVSV